MARFDIPRTTDFFFASEEDGATLDEMRLRLDAHYGPQEAAYVFRDAVDYCVKRNGKATGKPMIAYLRNRVGHIVGRGVQAPANGVDITGLLAELLGEDTPTEKDQAARKLDQIEARLYPQLDDLFNAVNNGMLDEAEARLEIDLINEQLDAAKAVYRLAS